MRLNNQIKFLSIVVPCYMEEKTITPTLESLTSVLRGTGLKYELICVIDGILDNTYSVVKKLKAPHLRIYAYEKNQGKGYAVRYGMAKAQGDVIGFMDANGIKPSSLSMLLQHLYWYNADIIIGSKRHPASKVDYPALRRLMSFLSQMATRLLFDVQVRDTQVGIKLFKRKVLEKILPRLVVTDWAFDIEMLAVPHYLGYKNIFESPIELEGSVSKETSAVISKGLFKNMFSAALDALAVFYRLRIQHFYDDSNSAYWHRSPDLEFERKTHARP